MTTSDETRKHDVGRYMAKYLAKLLGEECKVVASQTALNDEVEEGTSMLKSIAPQGTQESKTQGDDRIQLT